MSSERPTLSIQDMPDSERPRERLIQHGVDALSNAELLAIILRTGTAQENAIHLAERIIAQHHGLHELAHTSAEALQQVLGLGTAKACQILAALELGKRAIIHNAAERPIVQSGEDAARLVMDMSSLPQEHVRVILLDNTRRVIAIPTVYIGTVNTSLLRVSELFREAITRNSAALILVHNHPSGDPSPSPEDIELTRAVFSAGKLLDIVALDHIIIASRGWRSLKEMGLL